MIRTLQKLGWTIGISALIVDATIRLTQYSREVAFQVPIEPIVHEQVEASIRAVAEQSYRLGFADGERAAREAASGVR